MSRKKKTTSKFRKNHPRETEKFYHVYDSKGGHPALVYYCNPDEDIYYIQRFSTKNRKGRVILKHNIDPLSNKKQYLIKRPEAICYDDMKYEEKYKYYRVHPEDLATVIKYQKAFLKKK